MNSTTMAYGDDENKADKVNSTFPNDPLDTPVPPADGGLSDESRSSMNAHAPATDITQDDLSHGKQDMDDAGLEAGDGSSLDDTGIATEEDNLGGSGAPFGPDDEGLQTDSSIGGPDTMDTVGTGRSEWTESDPGGTEDGDFGTTEHHVPGGNDTHADLGSDTMQTDSGAGTSLNDPGPVPDAGNQGVSDDKGNSGNGDEGGFMDKAKEKFNELKDEFTGNDDKNKTT